MKILLVEDDLSSLKTLEQTLKKNGYETIWAGSVKKAIISLKSNSSIKLVIWDNEMHGDGGFDILSFLNSNLRFKHIAVLVVSHNDDKELILRCIKMGARDYMVKPIDPRILVGKVEKILEMDRGKILIVDDEQLIRELLVRILESAGFKTITAGSGEHALEILEENRVAAIISDIAMPGMNGIDLLTKVKEKHGDIPILMITGFAGQYRGENVLAAGADGFIIKPFKNIDIVNKIKSLI